MPKDFKWPKCHKKMMRYCAKKGKKGKARSDCADRICGSIKAKYG